MLAERAFGQAASVRSQIGQLRVAVLHHEFRNVIAPAPAARIAHDLERGAADVGQGERAVARHASTPLKRGILDLEPVSGPAICAPEALRHDPL
jgi:hypothetical protein